MPIRIVTTRRGSRPAFFCDACGAEIKRADRGNYHWRTEDEADPTGTPLFFSCKTLECSRSVDRRYKTACCVGLAGFLFFLAHNMKFDMAKARKHEEMFPGGFF